MPDDRYWIYDDPTTNHARVHRKECESCRPRLNPGKDKDRWIGEFVDPQTAFYVLQTLNRKDSQGCGSCKPDRDTERRSADKLLTEIIDGICAPIAGTILALDERVPELDIAQETLEAIHGEFSRTQQEFSHTIARTRFLQIFAEAIAARNRRNRSN